MPYNNYCCAGVAHLVERDLAKVEVASSSLVARSKKKDTRRGVFLFGAALLLRKSGRLRAGDLTCKGNPTKVSLAYISSDGLNFATYDHYATFVEIV